MIPVTSHDPMGEQVIASCYAVRFFYFIFSVL
jgi:hypothetical protein